MRNVTAKAFDRTRHPSLVKTLRKIETEANFLKVCYPKPPAANSIGLSGERRTAFPPNLGSLQGRSSSPFLCYRKSQPEYLGRKRESKTSIGRKA
jgi:hypothetical protein